MFDVAIIGGGIVGLATARSVAQRDPAARIVVLDKEPATARHQTGHNSGVVHSGIYYRPGTLKARMCLAGSRSIVEFAREHDIAVEVTGKLIVATRLSELQGLDALERRGTEHGLSVTRLTPQEAARTRAPPVVRGRTPRGQHRHHRLRRRVRPAGCPAPRLGGGEIHTGAEVTAITTVAGTHRLGTTMGDVECLRVVNCTGLQSDRVAEHWRGRRCRPASFRSGASTSDSDPRHSILCAVSSTPFPTPTSRSLACT